MDSDGSPKPSTSKVPGYTDDEDEEKIPEVCEETKSTELVPKSEADKDEIEKTNVSSEKKPALRRSTRSSLKRIREKETKEKTTKEKTAKEKAKAQQPLELDADVTPKKRKLFFMEDELPDVLDVNFYDSGIDRLTPFFGTFDPIDPKYSFPLEKLCDLDAPYFFNLRRMKIANMVEGDHFRFDCINTFQQLEHLEFEIRETMWQWSGQVHIIKLPKLKIVSAHLGCEIPREIVFDCPINFLEVEYKALVNPEFPPLSQKIKIKDPSGVTKLYVLGKFKVDELKQFTGVKHFHYAIEDMCDFKHSEILKVLPNLQILEAVNYLDFTSVSKILTDFKETREGLERKNIEIYFNSINIDRLLSLHLTESNFKSDNELRLQISNYNYLSELVDCASRMFYSELFELIGNQTPADFHEKYKTIEEVYITKEITNTDHFIEFLNNCINMKKLNLAFVPTKQEVFDRIKTSIARHRIANLEINIPTNDYDFDFIADLTNLAWFSTNQKVQRKVITKLSKLKHLEYITCLYKKFRIEIYVSADQKYTLMKGPNLNFMDKYLVDGTFTTLLNRLK